MELSNRYYRELVFWVGILATVAYRIIILLNRLPQHIWADISWYIGTIGFVWYFAHRYRIENKRAKLIEDSNLIEKIHNSKTLTKADREAIEYTLSSLESSKASWNYVAIFVTSALALLADIIIRFII